MLANRNSRGIGFLAYPADGNTSVVDPIEIIRDDPSAVTIDIPGIYRDPGGIISDQERFLRLTMMGMPAGSTTPKPATNYIPWLLAAAGVVVLVAARR